MFGWLSAAVLSIGITFTTMLGLQEPSSTQVETPTAETASEIEPWIPFFADLGLSGLAVLGFLRGWIYTGSSYKEVLLARDQAYQELRELHQKIEDNFLPEMINARKTQERMIQLMDEFIKEAIVTRRVETESQRLAEKMLREQKE